ncbi:16S rRNA (guanine(527)-N(7))-methyltransferase RsmG [Adlercreutzia mucosicola]|jgi:16S rRNA (guanine527-N7)-methyltransferase|uniref:16S rRNA (guanine(527)-N(7))-methyltransferase RsmG n=1 Tax=Adlercreutzia mucosicola TaxID=580026 RepID=UPI00040FC2F2|nr:16S rRNA (guanine(527)-N(7))-methyltransferase RsmG [Adlercreutzia mucosicola]MCR2034034.1 16S rRNA (guanine(527)-N(7))-methyltransferase RsmG [Adlercreutzia mucosicola]
MTSPVAQELMGQYLDLILEANKTTNLTRITSRDEALVLHIEDSLVGLEEVSEAPEGLYGDLGSGGGFPGVPLALATGRETVLVDSVKKKMAIVQQAVNQLGLGRQITTCSDRIEDLALDRPGSFSVLTARALSRLVALLELSSPLLVKGGRLVCYKAQLSDEEMQEALSVEDLLGMRLVSQRETMLSDGETRRTIVVFEKVGKAKLKLPRRIGAAQKTPLKPRS